MAGLPLAEGSGQNRKAASDLEELLATVAISFEANNDALGAFRADVESVLESPSVKEERVLQDERETVVLSPRFVTYSRITATPTVFRCDCLGTGRDAPPTSTFAFNGVLWKEYSRTRGLGIIRRPNQMSAFVALDPREWFMNDVRNNFVPLIRSAKVSRSVQIRLPGGEKGCRLECVTALRGRLDVEVSPSMSFLPVSTVWYFPDGSVAQVFDVTYEYIKSRSAWVPKRSVDRLLSKGTARTPDDARRIPRGDLVNVSTNVLSNIVWLNPGSPEATGLFESVIPANVHTEDVSRLQLTTANPTNDARIRHGGASVSRTMVLTAFCASAVVFLLFLARRHRSRRSTSSLV